MCSDENIDVRNVRIICVFMFPYLNEFAKELFVNVCLDFSIAQYMEDCFLFTYKKDFALSDKKKKNISDILECSINKKLL